MGELEHLKYRLEKLHRYCTLNPMDEAARANLSALQDRVARLEKEPNDAG